MTFEGLISEFEVVGFIKTGKAIEGSIEKWKRIVQAFDEKLDLDDIVENAERSGTCALCGSFDDCKGCPLIEVEEHCSKNDSAYNMFLDYPTKENALKMLKVLEGLK